MALTPILLLNTISQLAVAFTSGMVAYKLGRQKQCLMKRPFIVLCALFFVMGLLNILWATGSISVSSWDNSFVLPLFNLAVLGVWFYLALRISGHHNLNYLTAVFVMAVNAFLVFRNNALISDLLISLTLLALFFHIGLINHFFVRKLSYFGMAYASLHALVSLLAHLAVADYVGGLWFIPNAALIVLVFMMFREGHFCNMPQEPAHEHIPVIIEIFKFGLFVVGLSMFLILGVLGVHELGHSLAAEAFGCSHDTFFGLGYALTHVECGSGSGSVLISLAGFILTVMISALMFLVGNDFARRISYLLLAFSFITATDDFAMLGVPHSGIIVIVFFSALLIAYGIMLIVKEYEVEYEKYETDMCSMHCSTDTHADRGGDT